MMRITRLKGPLHHSDHPTEVAPANGREQRGRHGLGCLLPLARQHQPVALHHDGARGHSPLRLFAANAGLPELGDGTERQTGREPPINVGFRGTKTPKLDP